MLPLYRPPSSERFRRGLRRAAPVLLFLLIVIIVALAASAARADSSRRRSAARAATRLEPPGLVIGEHKLLKVVDGDTIKVAGLDGSLRLLGIDTEETFKSAADRRRAAAGLDPYRVAKRGTSRRPVKMATPMGEQAKAFAQEFFAGVDRVRLERDHPAEIRDRYDRYLAYVLVERHGAWLNFNVECVRAGMAPYFPKYGTSRRFHAEFVAAEADAKRAQRGIWAPDAPGYTDYTEREAWWAARGAFIDEFRREAEGQPDHVDITHQDALGRLEARVGQPVVVLGIVGDIRIADRAASGIDPAGSRASQAPHRDDVPRAGPPARVMLSRRFGSDLPLVFFDRDVLASSRIAAWKGELVIVTGVPTLYTRRRDRTTELQIVIRRADQIRLSAVPGLERPARDPEAP